ncbi:MAG: hypothetical protein ABWY80_09180 [Acidimicrobiia bacterium]
MLWALRIVWFTLPLTAGAAFGAAVRGWSDAPSIVAQVLVWASWAVGLLAVVVPRPHLLTAVRVIAPAFLVVAMVIAIDGAASTTAAIGALVATVVAGALVSSHDLALAAANAIAYGDEQRVLLRTPPALFLGPLPIARVLVAGALVAPPLLLADERWVLGTITLVVAIPIVIMLPRALHGLSRRWGVLVPAGFVIVDPLTLSDPVLFLRERILRMQAEDATASSPPGVLDLRLGAAAGSVALEFDEDAELGRRGRRGRGGTIVQARELRFAVARRASFLEAAGARRIRVVA